MEKRTGGCHCKAVRYEVEIDLVKPVIECDCSYCQMKGTLLTAVPDESFTLLSGEDQLTEYRFNTKKIQHLFCRICGVQAHASAEWEGKLTHMINIRTIDDIDLATIERMPYEGRLK